VAEVAEEGSLALDASAFRSTAAAVRRRFDDGFVEDEAAWPYAVDGAGLRIAYHDANDLPVALAPLWGFCGRDDAGWLATMAFGLSDFNPGWHAGGRAGLGSAHTPGAWTLGDIQAWVRARTVGDPAAAQAALQRLDAVAFEDAMLPEAYDNGGARIRHWFAWPGAALAALRLLHRDGRLEERLSVRAIR
jgi:meiotically up-regulated gene 157 (Mug157) protein